jgi:hypothetical protein
MALAVAVLVGLVVFAVCAWVGFRLIRGFERRGP